MTIHLATDHAGFELKNEVLAWLRDEKFEVIDHGACNYDEEDDFPDFISLAAAAVSAAPKASRGIIFGGSGQGEAILANRYPSVRAAVYYGSEDSIPILSRQHNDANMLSIGARFVSTDEAKKVIWDWLKAEPLTEKKYQRRNKKIETITKSL